MLEEMKNQEKYQPIVIAFGLDENVLQTIPHILQISCFEIFLKF
jgi:hypothetical protein